MRSALGFPLSANNGAHVKPVTAGVPVIYP
jgi:hypothetical protein